MFLEPWMIIILIASFGACAWYSHRLGQTAGVKIGAMSTITMMENLGIITVDSKTGFIKASVPDPAPKKKRAPRKKTTDPL
jgi:hypothetical protein